MEGWRDFLSKASDSSGNKDKEKPPPPSSVVAALMKRGGLTRKEAEEWLDSEQSTVELEEVKTGTHGSEAGPTIPGKPEGWGKQPKPVDMSQFGDKFTEEEAQATLEQLVQDGYDVGDGSYVLKTLLSMPRELADEGLDSLAALLEI